MESGISGSSAGFLPALYDTALCKVVKPGEPCDLYVGGTQLQVPGKNLKPEKSTSFTLGVLLEPTPWANLSVDYYDIKVTAVDVATGKTLKPGRVSKVRKSTPWLSPGDAWPINTSTTWKVRPSSSTAVHREGSSITRTRAKYKATASSAWQLSRSYTKTVKLTGVTVAAYPDGPAECYYSMKNSNGWGPWIPCGDDPEAFDPDA